MKPILFIFAFLLASILLSYLADKIRNFNTNRRLRRKLAQLAEQVDRIDIHGTESQLSKLSKVAHDLYTRVDASRSRKPSV